MDISIVTGTGGFILGLAAAWLGMDRFQQKRIDSLRIEFEKKQQEHQKEHDLLITQEHCKGCESKIQLQNKLLKDEIVQNIKEMLDKSISSLMKQYNSVLKTLALQLPLEKEVREKIIQDL